MKKILLVAAFALACHSAYAEDVDAETSLTTDLGVIGGDAQAANFATKCQIRDFDWASAVNSILLERASHDMNALKRAGDSPSDIRTQWKMIARAMTVSWDVSQINCEVVASTASRLDPLAKQAGYAGVP